jgi:hypothetical protein
VHELGCDQPSTIRELLDITTRHASGKEAVGTAFVRIVVARPKSVEKLILRVLRYSYMRGK